MLTPSDVVRAAGLGVRLEIDEPLVTDWRARYIDLARVHYEQGQVVEMLNERARRRLAHCRALFVLVALFGAAGFLVGRWWR